MVVFSCLQRTAFALFLSTSVSYGEKQDSGLARERALVEISNLMAGGFSSTVNGFSRIPRAHIEPLIVELELQDRQRERNGLGFVVENHLRNDKIQKAIAAESFKMLPMVDMNMFREVQQKGDHEAIAESLLEGAVDSLFTVPLEAATTIASLPETIADSRKRDHDSTEVVNSDHSNSLVGSTVCDLECAGAGVVTYFTCAGVCVGTLPAEKALPCLVVGCPPAVAAATEVCLKENPACKEMSTGVADIFRQQLSVPAQKLLAQAGGLIKNPTTLSLLSSHKKTSKASALMKKLASKLRFIRFDGNLVPDKKQPQSSDEPVMYI